MSFCDSSFTIQLLSVNCFQLVLYTSSYNCRLLLSPRRDINCCEVNNMNPIIVSVFLAIMSYEEFFYYLHSRISDLIKLDTDQVKIIKTSFEIVKGRKNDVAWHMIDLIILLLVDIIDVKRFSSLWYKIIFLLNCLYHAD